MLEKLHVTLENNSKYSKKIKEMKSKIITYYDFPITGITYK
jgi:hypothetical protein